MDIFALRHEIIGRYQSYVSSFVPVRDPDTRAFVDQYFNHGALWPEPLVQLNPSFLPGPTIDELIASGTLDQRCGAIFRRGKSASDPHGQTLRLHHHQAEAVRTASRGASYVLTTGTGSGKSLAYMIPIVDHVLKRGSGRGIQAIVVYPMNALANSQADELTKFLDPARSGRPPVTFKLYTGATEHAAREEMRKSPPDILLTNFVMLEMIMTRPVDRHIVNFAEGLEFLVLDELHTYRGRQGADVAMLVRRVRERVGAPSMRCVGTSATLASEGTRSDRTQRIAEVATSLFGTTITPDNVIGETLRRAIDEPVPSADGLRRVLIAPPAAYPTPFDEFKRQPLVAWAEVAFGLHQPEPGVLERRPPRSVTTVAGELAEESGVDLVRCEDELRRLLLAGNNVDHPVTGRPLFAFRLHQFIGRGDRVFVTPEPARSRHITTKEQRDAPADPDAAPNAPARPLLPLAFCRACGAEYIVAMRDAITNRLEPRELGDRAANDNHQAGFLLLDPLGEVTFDPNKLDDLPEDWLETTKQGGPRLRSTYTGRVPHLYKVTRHGELGGLEHAPADATRAWWFPAPFSFCLHCGIVHHNVRERDFVRLAELSTEGRSTATTILSLATVRALRGTPDLDDDVKKLLSFTDNRQDASLQAGHFNDFIQVARLRSALCAALDEAGPDGLTPDVIADRVLEKLALEPSEYARNPSALVGASQTRATLRELVAYLIFHDLRRGWRVNSPNLEELGLLDVQYEALDEMCAQEDIWQRHAWLLADAAPAVRRRIVLTTLDHIRRTVDSRAYTIALDVEHFNATRQRQFKSRADQYLAEPWSVGLDEKMLTSSPLPSPLAAGGVPSGIGPRTAFGRYMRRVGTWDAAGHGDGQRMNEADYRELFDRLLGVLAEVGYLEKTQDGYLLRAGVLRWHRGDGTPRIDPVRRSSSEAALRVNAFFADFYQISSAALRALTAREHTAQVDSDEREKREDAFKSASLPILFCSPTMELGVDIAGLQAVHMRNVPPTPANYAQRAGRAGRSGQPALVLVYCSDGSPHDSYYFRQPELMVRGSVQPPRVDLVNEDLLRAHVHAILIGELGLELGNSVADILDLTDTERFPLKAEVADSFDNAMARARALTKAARVLAELPLDASHAPWFVDGWVTSQVDGARTQLDRACDRWRALYRAAAQQRERQHAILNDALTTPERRHEADRLYREATIQQGLLLSQDVSRRQSDFYSYRYVAAEGFLPGYNFPRLPLSAFLPGRGRRDDSNVFLSRARFLAISEFGPRSIIYHEGSRYRIERVMFASQDADRNLSEGKLCATCGYGHIGGEDSKADVCENCGSLLTGKGQVYFPKLLRLTNVGARSIDRITSDEEERLRLGYDVRTAFRIDPTASRRVAVFTAGSAEGAAGDGADSPVVAQATYAPNAMLWRINLGWTARKDPSQVGFGIEMNTGLWRRAVEHEAAGADSESADDPTVSTRARVETVVPFVDDHRNSLVLKLPSADPSGGDALATVMYALKRGIEAHYQIEDRELAAETLPSRAERTSILFYEAVEGGAGILAQLVDDRLALSRVARTALEILHFDPETGRDTAAELDRDEPCQRACHECLLSYANQREHAILNRHLARDILRDLVAVRAHITVAGRGRAEHFDYLAKLCDTGLEREFLAFLRDTGHRLPTDAQRQIENARPDFVYGGTTNAAIFVDGPVHAYPDIGARDETIRAWLTDRGVTVIAIGHDPHAWPTEVAAFPWVFGPPGTQR